LAELIEIGFAESLDRSGRQMVQGLRMFARWGRLGGWLSRWMLPPAANPEGFVWEEDGQIVGNASLLPVTGYRHRWVMANVVVRPAHRRRGIARALVAASLEHARSRRAREIILQVDQGNKAALQLYQGLGFSKAPTRTTWIGRLHGVARGSRVDTAARRRRPDEWREQYQLARRIHPDGLIWPYPTTTGLFRPKSWERRMRLGTDRHWVWFEQERLLGSVSLRWTHEPGQMRIVMVVDPDHQGEIEGELLGEALRGSRAPAENLILDYPTGIAEDMLKALGFQVRRRLIWMSRGLQ
jgi:ribosomal protein S18 acetylase RimI-like enzyme